jgi:hypothetical protein
MIKPFLICMLNFLVVEINSLSSSEKCFPREPFIRGAVSTSFACSALWGAWGAATGPQGCLDWPWKMHQWLRSGGKVMRGRREDVTGHAHLSIPDCSLCRGAGKGFHIPHSTLIYSGPLGMSLPFRASVSASINREAY